MQVRLIYDEDLDPEEEPNLLVEMSEKDLEYLQGLQAKHGCLLHEKLTGAEREEVRAIIHDRSNPVWTKDIPELTVYHDDSD